MYQMLKRIFFSEKIMFIAVAINAIIIFLLAFPDMDYRNILLQLDVFFIFLFFLEVLVKMYELKINEYFSDKWNIFDFLITMFSLPILFWPLRGSSKALHLCLQLLHSQPLPSRSPNQAAQTLYPTRFLQGYYYKHNL